MNHFEARPVCLARLFDIFSVLAADPGVAGSQGTEKDHQFPLLRSDWSISQDVTDHSRAMYADEQRADTAYKPEHVRRREENDRFELLLDQLSEQELDEMLAMHLSSGADQSADDEPAIAVPDGEYGDDEEPEPREKITSERSHDEL